MEIDLTYGYDIKAVKDKVRVTGVCPKCGKTVQFISILDCNDFSFNDGGCNCYYLGQRLCPDKDCKAHIFFYQRINSGGPIYTEIIPNRFVINNLNVNKLHKNIKNCIKEAITCYNNSCYIASAIMIRKTLEEICRLEGAKGKDLHSRIKDLENKITISKPLYDSMFELKYLGNDAAHTLLTNFEQIGRKEVKLGLVLLIEILRALYEHSDLLEEFKSLKCSE